MGGKRILEQAIEFEGIVNNIFKEAGYETNTFDYYRDHLYDIEAKKGEETYCIEIKFMNNKNRAPLSLYKKAITKLINATDKKSGIPVFVVSGLLERKEKEFLKQREDVQILDISNLLYSVEDNDKLTNQLISFLPYSVMDIVSQKCFVKIDSLQHGGYAKSLIKELELINAGRDDFNKYEDVCMKILQYIFEDDLTLWLSQAKSKSYSLTYDAKSTAKNKIAAATAHLSGLRRHREAYNADFSLEVAVDYQGAEDELSAISVEAKNEKVTMMTAKDLIKLLLLITPKQIGLDKLRELFETCYMPQDVHEWIENIEKTEVEKPPYYELVDVVYELQKTDSEAPELGTIRYKLKEKMNKNYSKMQVREWLVLLSNLIPGCVTIDGNYVGVQASAQIIKERIHKAINDMPLGYKPLYDEIFK